MRAVAQFQLWDFEGVQLDAAIAQLAGDLGFDALSIGLVQPAVSAIRRQVTDGPRVIRQPAGFQFQPDAKAYSSTRIKPSPSKWLRQRNPLERIARIATDQRLAVEARIDLRDMSDILDRAPHAGTVDLFGEPHGARLCPSNPDVLNFVGAIVEDLARNYPLNRIELSGIGYADRLQAANTEAPQFNCDDIESYLLALCFCPSCRDRATRDGVKIDRVMRAVSESLTECFALEIAHGGVVEEFIQSEPDIAAFEESRRHSTLNQLTDLRQRTKLPIAWRTDATMLPATAAAYRELVDAIILNDDLSLADPETDLQIWRKRWGNAAAIELAIRPGPPDHLFGQSLVRRVKTLCDEGHTSQHFGPMGELPPPCLDWIRQAIRYAKRESTA